MIHPNRQYEYKDKKKKRLNEKNIIELGKATLG